MLALLCGCLTDSGMTEVHYILSSDGLFDGVAFVELASADDCLKAVSKNNACIGKNHIEGTVENILEMKTLLSSSVLFNWSLTGSSMHSWVYSLIMNCALS